MKLFFTRQDPKRFANAFEYAPGFHGELEGAKDPKSIYEKVLIDNNRNVIFTDKDPFAGIEISASLSEKDIMWLRKKNLDPTNPAYSKAKAYWAKNPACDKKDLAEAANIGKETAKDVISGFRKNIF
jgi:hypothetical protein